MGINDDLHWVIRSTNPNNYQKILKETITIFKESGVSFQTCINQQVRENQLLRIILICWKIHRHPGNWWVNFYLYFKKLLFEAFVPPVKSATLKIKKSFWIFCTWALIQLARNFKESFTQSNAEEFSSN
jgi:hypothetical protein